MQHIKHSGKKCLTLYEGNKKCTGNLIRQNYWLLAVR